MVACHIAPQMAPCCSFSHSLSAFTRVTRRIALQMAPCCSFFCLSMAFTMVCTQYCLVADSRLHILPLVNSFHDVCVLYFSTDGTVLLILPLVDGFYGLHSIVFILSLLDSFSDDLRAILFSGWQYITLSSVRQWHSWLTHHFTQRMVPRSLFFHLSMGVMSVCTPYCLQTGSPLLILPLLKGFSDNSHPLLLGWQRISCFSAHQWLSQWIVGLIE